MTDTENLPSIHDWTDPRWLRHIEFPDRAETTEDPPVHVPSRPILINGEKADLTISKNEPLIVRTRDGLGETEVLVTFTVLASEVVSPTIEWRGVEAKIGRWWVLCPPQDADDDYVWSTTTDLDGLEWVTVTIMARTIAFTA